MDSDSAHTQGSMVVGWVIVLLGLVLRFMPDMWFELSSLIAFAFLCVWLFNRRQSKFGVSTLVLVAVASFSVSLGMRSFSPRQFTNDLLQARDARAAAQTPEAKAARQRIAESILTFRRNVYVGQLVLVSDDPHDEHFLGEIVGHGGSIVDLAEDRDVSVKLDVSGTTLSAPLARIFPMGPDLTAILNQASLPARPAR
jgi:hypothetical protein